MYCHLFMVHGVETLTIETRHKNTQRIHPGYKGEQDYRKSYNRYAIRQILSCGDRRQKTANALSEVFFCRPAIPAKGFCRCRVLTERNARVLYRVTNDTWNSGASVPQE